MDAVSQPIFVDESFRRISAASIEYDKDPTYIEQMELALLYERTRDFVELINNSPSHLLDENLDWIHTLMFMWDSAKCVAAVLDGQTKITEIPLAMSWLSQVDNCPLLQAAVDNAPKITALLLQRGFSADVRGDLHGILKNKILPLHVILDRLRTLLLLFLPKEKQKLSATMLVVKLCQLEIRRSLETIRLLALNTRELKREFYNYIKEGKMIEVGALLLVAKSQILSPSTSTVNKEFRSISEMHDFVLNAKCLKRNNNKLFEMEETLVLLRIIDKIGNKLATLLRHEFMPTYMGACSPLLVESLIEDAGFDPKNVYYNHPFPSFCRSEVVSYFSKRAIDDCEKTIRTSEMLPSWLKEAVWRGLGDKFGITSRLTYPVLAASPMPENMTPLHHLLKTTAPFLGMIKKVFRRG